MIITPSISLMYCPTCGEKLIIEKMFTGKETYCEKCGYVEPAGSAYFVTFVVEVLSRFIQNLGIKQISLGAEKQSDLRAVLDANNILPAILINARLNTEHVGTKLSHLPLTTVNDNLGFYQRRVVTTSNNINNPALCVAALTETLYSAYLLSEKNPENRQSKTLDLSLLSPVSAMHVDNVKSFASLHAEKLNEFKSNQMEQA